jgi:predicted Zn-dependent protease
MFKDVQFHMVNSNTLNAFTTGGHHVYVYSELFKMCKNEDEFAAVCSHEFAHIYCRHVQAGMNRQMGILGVGALGAVGGAAVAGKDNLVEGATAGGTVGMAAGQFLGMGFTRKDEDQADQFGFQFYTHAGWDPNQFANFFKSMIAAGYDKTPEMESDHPKLSTRVDNTARRVKELPPTAAGWRKPDVFTQAQFAAVQARVVKISATPPKGKAAAAASLMFSAFPSCVAPTETKDQKTAQQKIMDALKASEK